MPELRHLRVFAFVAVCATVTYTSLMPIPDDPGPIMSKALGKDYLIHSVAYFAVSFTAMLAFVKRPGIFKARLILWALCVFAGGMFEILQAAIPGINRSCMFFDFVANSAGAAIGALLTPPAFLVARQMKTVVDPESEKFPGVV